MTQDDEVAAQQALGRLLQRGSKAPLPVLQELLWHPSPQVPDLRDIVHSRSLHFTSSMGNAWAIQANTLYINIYIYILRKPADRLGKVVLANEVSIRGSGGWSWRMAPKSRN